MSFGSGNIFADLGIPNPEEELAKAQALSALHSGEPQTDIPLTASAASEVTSDPTGLIERLEKVGITGLASWDEVTRLSHEAAQSLLLQSQKIKEANEETNRQCHNALKALLRAKAAEAALSTLRQEHEALSDSHRDLASRLARSGEEAARLTQEVKRKDKALEEIYAASKSDRRLAINMEAINRIARSALPSKEKPE
jgi:hypothetical protein